MSIFDERKAYKPSEYPFADTLRLKLTHSFWTHDELTFSGDKMDFLNLSDKDKEIVLRTLTLIATVEVKVKDFWTQLGNHFPKPEFKNLGVTAGESEVRHAESYDRLLDVLNMQEYYEKALENPFISGRFDYLEKYLKLSPGNSDKSKYILKLILFTILIENVSLFSQFATIMYFFRHHGIMKDIRNIIKWTAIDEQCFPLKTEVLTPNGWRFIEDMGVGDPIYGFKNGSLHEEKVIKTIRKPFSGELITIGNDRHSISVTPNHDMIAFKNQEWIKVKANDIKYNNHIKVPTTVDFKSEQGDTLSDLDRLKIAIQADGCHINWINKDGEKLRRGKSGGFNYRISLLKQRKKEQLDNLLLNLDIPFKKHESPTTHGSIYSIALDYGEDYKSLDWVLKKKIDKKFCEDFIEEVLKWDGSVSNGSKCYTSTNKQNIEIVERIALLAGYRVNTYENKDSERSDNYNNCYKLTLSNKDSGLVHGYSYKKTPLPYDGDVVCVTVPSGGIVVKQGKSPFITGNCHSQIGFYIINILREEHPELFTEELTQEISKACKKAIKYEGELLNWVFENGELEKMSKDDLHNYMKNRVDEALQTMGFEKIFNETEPASLRFFFEEVFADSQDDFFAVRPVDYTLRDKSFDGDELF